MDKWMATRLLSLLPIIFVLPWLAHSQKSMEDGSEWRGRHLRMHTSSRHYDAADGARLENDGAEANPTVEVVVGKHLLQENTVESDENRAADTQEDSQKEPKKVWADVTMAADGESEILPFMLMSDRKVDSSKNRDDSKPSMDENTPNSIIPPGNGTLNATLTKNGTEGEKRDDVGEMIDHLLDKLEDNEEVGAGKFNETLEKQEGTLEWVARVGKHHQKPNSEPAGEAAADGSGKGSKAGNDSSVVEVTEKVEETSGNKEESSKKEKSIFDFMMGKSDEQPPENNQSQIINGQQSSKFKSEAELKELSEKQAKEAAQKQVKQSPPAMAEVNTGSEDVARLIDSNDNEYVISNPGKGSKMQLTEDLTLISDIVKVIVAAAIGALTCGLMGQPLILGYLGAGMIVGPGGFRLIHELVQVETLAQFGVIFLLFALGIEFDLAKMHGCQAVALGGGGLQIVAAMFFGALFSTVTTQGIFIGAFLSMSSTAVVLKCLMDANMSSTEYGQIMLGTLILQDCALGLLLAVLPALAGPLPSLFALLHPLLRALTLLGTFCAFAFILTKLVVPRFLHQLNKLSKYSSESYELGCVGLCLCMALLSERVGLSLEVGAFVAGLMLSGGKHSEKTLHHIEPIRNIFAALFLTSIGMVMNPEFLWKHSFILLTSLGVVFFGKACLIALTVRLFGYNNSTAISVGIALSQIGEFSFVLLSRAQSLKLVSHKVYLLLMGTTALSLMLTPFSFKIVVWIVSLDEKFKQRLRLGGIPLTTLGHPPTSDSESVVSPHVMTLHRESDMFMFKRLRSKSAAAPSQDDDRDVHEDEKMVPHTEEWNANKTAQTNRTGRQLSPRSPGPSPQRKGPGYSRGLMENMGHLSANLMQVVSQ